MDIPGFISVVCDAVGMVVVTPAVSSGVVKPVVVNPVVVCSGVIVFAFSGVAVGVVMKVVVSVGVVKPVAV